MKRDRIRKINDLREPDLRVDVVWRQRRTTVDELSGDLGPDVALDDVGVRVISRDLPRGLVAAHNEVEAAKQRRAAEKRARPEQARAQAREQSRAQREVERARRALIDEQQARIRAANPNVSPLELLMAGSDSPAMAAADERMDDWLSATPNRPIQYRPYTRMD